MVKPVPEGRYLELSNGQRIHYHDQGSGSVLIFLHGSGFGANGWSSYKYNLTAFVTAGYRCILIDTPGFGYSDPSESGYSLNTIAESIYEFVVLSKISEATFIGNSHGGAVAMQFALNYPDRVRYMILLAPAGLENSDVYARMEGIRRTVRLAFRKQDISKSDLRSVLQLQLSDPELLNEETLNERYEMIKVQSIGNIRELKIQNLSDRLTELKCPILLFWGRSDKYCPQSGLNTMIKACDNIQNVLLEDCGHWIMIEQSDLFNQISIDFIANH
jgi:4,5:9,10-diseco-3-hydroxy-5,9,17-trioxoandrosta-1(10),2-diene-4-oate hydrolase